jgi:hypothetical protein
MLTPVAPLRRNSGVCLEPGGLNGRPRRQIDTRSWLTKAGPLQRDGRLTGRGDRHI